MTRQDLHLAPWSLPEGGFPHRPRATPLLTEPKRDTPVLCLFTSIFPIVLNTLSDIP